jgi:hypothetical protein
MDADRPLLTPQLVTRLRSLTLATKQITEPVHPASTFYTLTRDLPSCPHYRQSYDINVNKSMLAISASCNNISLGGHSGTACISIELAFISVKITNS